MTKELTESKAFKSMSKNLTGYDGFQFAVGAIYEIESEKEFNLCESGFHACINLVDCFPYYHTRGNNRFFEVTIFGDYEIKRYKIWGRKNSN